MTFKIWVFGGSETKVIIHCGFLKVDLKALNHIKLKREQGVIYVNGPEKYVWLCLYAFTETINTHGQNNIHNNESQSQC